MCGSHGCTPSPTQRPPGECFATGSLRPLSLLGLERRLFYPSSARDYASNYNTFIDSVGMAGGGENSCPTV